MTKATEKSTYTWITLYYLYFVLFSKSNSKLKHFTTTLKGNTNLKGHLKRPNHSSLRVILFTLIAQLFCPQAPAQK